MFRSKFISTNNIRTHVLDSYEGEVPILMAHGFTDSAECLIPMAERLPDKLSPKVYDARAHGLSEAPEEGYSEKDMATHAVELVDSLALENPILYGHGMGANTMAIAASEIDDVQAIILEDPPGMMSDKDEYDIRIKRKRLEEWRKYSHEEVRAEYSQYPESMADRVATARKQIRTEALKIAERGYSPIGDILHSKADTLILRPDPEEVSRPVETPELPSNADEEIITGASHTVFRDRPNDFTDTISEFIINKID